MTTLSAQTETVNTDAAECRVSLDSLVSALRPSSGWPSNSYDRTAFLRILGEEYANVHLLPILTAHVEERLKGLETPTSLAELLDANNDSCLDARVGWLATLLLESDREFKRTVESVREDIENDAAYEAKLAHDFEPDEPAPLSPSHYHRSECRDGQGCALVAGDPELFTREGAHAATDC